MGDDLAWGMIWHGTPAPEHIRFDQPADKGTGSFHQGSAQTPDEFDGRGKIASLYVFQHEIDRVVPYRSARGNSCLFHFLVVVQTKYTASSLHHCPQLVENDRHLQFSQNYSILCGYSSGLPSVIFLTCACIVNVNIRY